MNEWTNLARSYFLSYCHIINKNFKRNWHHELIAGHLDDIADGKSKRLIISLPPRHGKSFMISQHFPTFYLGRNPKHNIISTAYNQSLAEDFGVYVKNVLMSEEYKSIFPITVNISSKSKKRFSIMEGGNYYAIGRGGPITGRGANCFPANTLIKTNIGDIPIDKLVQLKDKPKVLSWNHEKQIQEWKQIVACNLRQSNQFFKIETINGKKLHCTPEHHIFFKERGYQQADTAIQWETLYTIKKKQILPFLWNCKNNKVGNLSKMLFYVAKENGRSCVLFLQKTISKEFLRIYQAFEKKSQRFVLFSELLTETPCNQKQAKMYSMQGTCGKKNKEVLQTMQIKMEITIKETCRKIMRIMQVNVQTFKLKISTLFKKLRPLNSLNTYDWKRKFSFQGWEKLCKAFSVNEENYQGKRQLSMRLLQFKFKSLCASYRRKSKKQYTRKFNSTLQEVSHGMPQIQEDSISLVQRICTKNQPVYDLQIEGNSNYFANEILVHNCIIIDDLIKNEHEARSETHRKAIVEWYKNTLRTRLMPNGSIIIVQTRWHQNDLIGELLKNSNEDWEYIKLPAIDENNKALWPEMYPLEVLETIKQEVGTMNFEGLYQQEPVLLEGNIIKGDWIQRYSNLPKIVTQDSIITFDLTFKGTKESDFVVGQKWQKVGADYYLLDMIRGQWDFTQTLFHMKQFLNKHKDCTNIVIEDAANASAVYSTIKQHISGVRLWKPQTSKDTRLVAVAPLFEAKNIYIPADEKYDIFVSELLGFPLSSHDDTVDACSMALLNLKTQSGGLIMSLGERIF